MLDACSLYSAEHRSLGFDSPPGLQIKQRIVTSVIKPIYKICFTKIRAANPLILKIKYSILNTNDIIYNQSKAGLHKEMLKSRRSISVVRVHRGSYLPTKFSRTELFPALWPPTTAICGR